MIGAKKWKLSGRWQKGVDFFFFINSCSRKKNFPPSKSFSVFGEKKNFGLFWSRVVFFSSKPKNRKSGQIFFCCLSRKNENETVRKIFNWASQSMLLRRFFVCCCKQLWWQILVSKTRCRLNVWVAWLMSSQITMSEIFVWVYR